MLEIDVESGASASSTVPQVNAFFKVPANNLMTPEDERQQPKAQYSPLHQKPRLFSRDSVKNLLSGKKDPAGSSDDDQLGLPSPEKNSIQKPRLFSRDSMKNLLGARDTRKENTTPVRSTDPRPSSNIVPRRRSSISITNAVIKPHKTSVFAKRQEKLKSMEMNEDSPESLKKDTNLSEILQEIRGKVLHIPGYTSEFVGDNDLAETQHSIDHLRGRDLYRVTKRGREMDPPVFYIRQHVCVFALRRDIRAIVQSHRVVFIVQKENDDEFHALEEHMHEYLMVASKAETGKKRNSLIDIEETEIRKLPFECRVYEGLFTTLIGIHREEYNVYKKLCNSFLSVLTGKKSGSLLTTSQQEHLRKLKQGVSNALTRIRHCSKMLGEILDDDQNILFMSLNEFKKRPDLYEIFNSAPNKATGLRKVRAAMSSTVVEEIEFLLQFHLIDCQKLEGHAETLLKRLEQTEQSILVRLSVSQNELLVANTVVTVLATAIGFGGFVAGIFGMNLDNATWLQPMSGSFYGVFFGSFAFVIVSAASAVYYMRATGILPSHVQQSSLFTAMSMTMGLLSAKEDEDHGLS